MNGDFSPIVAGLGLADENARLKQQLAQQTAALQTSRDVIRWLRAGTCPHITGKTYQNDAWFCDACAKKLQQCLLGDAAQEESPLDPSAGEDAVIERLRELEEKS